MAMITTSPPATSSMAPPHPSRAKLKVTDLNPHLSCILCGGYFIDATTITECLHSFCRACIVRYLETSKYCPVCEVQIHKTRPLRCIRSDKMLQDIVYKLVPGLYQNEMKKRRELYASQPPEALKESRDAEDRGEGLEQRFIYTAEELFSLSLEYVHQESGNTENTDNTEPKRRFLRCPAAVTISHLKKFIRLKYGIPDKYQVDLRYQEEPLQDDYSLMDVAYIFAWKRSGPLKFSYRIHERPKKLAKRIRLAGMSSPDSSDTKANESRKSDSLLETDTSTVLPISSKTASKCSGEGKVPEVKELLSEESEKDNPMTSFFHSSIPSAAELFSTRVETKKSSKKAAKLNSVKSRKAGTFRSNKQSSKRGSSASKKSSHSSSSTSAKHSKISVNFISAMTNRTEKSSSTPLAVVPPTKNHSSPPPLNEKKAVPPPKVPKLTIPLTPKILEAANSLQQLQQRQHQKQQHQQQQKSHHQKQQKHLQQEQHKQQHHHKQKHPHQQQQKHALTLCELEPFRKLHKHLQQDQQTERVQCQQQKEQVPTQEEPVQQENTVQQQKEKEELNQQQKEDSPKDEQQKDLLPQQQLPSQETQSEPETKEPEELPHELQQSQSQQELFQQEKETQQQQELPAATPDNNRLPQQVEEEEDKIDLDCDLFEGGPLVIAESLDVDDSADAKEHKSQIHDDDSKDETYKKTDKMEEDIDVENCEVDSGRGSDTSGRTGDDDIGSPGSSTAARTPDSEKTNPFLIPSPSSNISLPSPKLNGTSPSHSVGNVGNDFTTPPISVVSSTAITNDSEILSNSSPNHRKDDLGVLDLSTCHRKRGHEGFPLPRPRQVANPPVLDKHRQTTPCLPLPSHPSFKLLPAVLPHTSIYKKNASSNFCRGNFRCKGSTLTVYNPDPSSTRPKIVIKSVESPRASDHGHGRHHHHSHHHSHHHQRM